MSRNSAVRPTLAPPREGVADCAPRAAGDWDIGPVKAPLEAGGGVRGESELTGDAKALTEIQAANMIIMERVNAYTRELTGLQAKLEGLHERVAEAEKQYAVRCPR